MSTSSSKPPVQSFEFTKRKRWSETLISELSETLVFVLSPTCKVLYCGSAIVELLGWKEDQLVDADLAAFIDDEDQENFRWTLTESFRSGQDLYTYARFKSEQPLPTDAKIKSGQLFEIKGHPNYLQDNQEPQCFFLTAMPYPSRNISMLNTFLDLKIENQKLSQRVNELKNAIDASQALENNSPISSPFAMSHFPPRFNQYTGPLIPNHSSLYSRGPPFLGGFDLSSASIHGARKSSLSRVDDTMVSPVNGRGGLGLTGDDDGGQKKKKPKKTLVGDEQRVCVTCGRTDSPEWRKGPLGPKTLCNACGLRWAKRNRKIEPDTATPSNLKGANGGDPSSQRSSLDLPCGQ